MNAKQNTICYYDIVIGAVCNYNGQNNFYNYIILCRWNSKKEFDHLTSWFYSSLPRESSIYERNNISPNFVTSAFKLMIIMY